MAGVGLPVVFIGDGKSYAGKLAAEGTLYNGVIASSPSPGSHAMADLNVTIGGASVLIAQSRQAPVGPGLGGPAPVPVGTFYVIG